MISIIISSANAQLLTDVILNIRDTIGVEYEIISIDNSNGSKGICEVYNIGAAKARYDLLCYMHEDIKFHTENWGMLVAEKFLANENLGVLGVVGSSYKSKAPSGWWARYSGDQLLHCNYIQHYKFDDQPFKHIQENPLGLALAPVVAIDGMWFCTTKEITKRFSFDEQLLKGFHCYDLDFCFQVGEHFNVAVTFDILIAHFSEGGYKKDWWLDTLRLHDKWKRRLPKYTADLDGDEKYQVEENAYMELIYLLEEMGYTHRYLGVFFTNQLIGRQMKWRMYFRVLKQARKHFRYLSGKKKGAH